AWPCRLTSLMNLPCPRNSRGSSKRSTGWPIPYLLMEGVIARHRRGCATPVARLVILSGAKDLMPVASGDEVLRCAQDDRKAASGCPLGREQSRQLSAFICDENGNQLGHVDVARVGRHVMDRARRLEERLADIEYLDRAIVELRPDLALGD